MVGLKRYPPTCFNCTENKSDDLFKQNISEISEESGKIGHFLLFQRFYGHLSLTILCRNLRESQTRAFWVSADHNG